MAFITALWLYCYSLRVLLILCINKINIYSCRGKICWLNMIILWFLVYNLFQHLTLSNFCTNSLFLLLLFTPWEFFTSVLADGLSLEFEWQQVSWTLLSILTVLNNAVVWMVSTRLPTSKSSILFNNPLVTVPKAPITIGIIVTFMFHSFFNSLAKSRYLSFFSHSFSFILWSAGTAKLTILQILFFFVDYYKVWSSG